METEITNRQENPEKENTEKQQTTWASTKAGKPKKAGWLQRRREKKDALAGTEKEDVRRAKRKI